MEELIIDNEFKSYVRPLTDEEYEKLKESILAEGIRDPLVVWKNVLLDGHHRFKLAQEHGLEYKTVEVDLPDIWAAKDWIIKNQLGRRNLTEQEASYYRGKLYESRKRQGERTDLTSAQNVLKFNTAEEIGKEYGVSHMTVKRDAEFSKAVDKVAEEVGEEAKRAILSGKANIPKFKVEKLIEVKQEVPDLIEPILDGSISIDDALIKAKIIKREQEIKKQKEAIESGAIELPAGKYDVIVIDPPWQYTTEYNPETRRVTSPYPEMSLEEIKNIEIPAKDDCILWLWTTQKFIWEAKEILDHWGFEYKAMLIWDKEKMGIGRWLRLQCEFCLLGIKGKPIWDIKDIRDIIREPRREHSRKPEAFYKMIDENFVGRKLDYFSREKREGWEVFGNDTEKF